MRVRKLLLILLLGFLIGACDSGETEQTKSADNDPSPTRILTDKEITPVPAVSPATGNPQEKTAIRWVDWHPNTLRNLLPWNVHGWNQIEKRPFKLGRWETISNISVELVFQMKGVKPLEPVVKALEPGSYVLEIDMPYSPEERATRVLMNFTIEHGSDEIHKESYCFYARNPLMDGVGFTLSREEVQLDANFDMSLCELTSIDKLIL